MSLGRVWIVDDSDADRRFAGHQFAGVGIEVDAVESGAEAVARVAAGERPDMIVLDQGMPGVDGLETARRLRTAGFTRQIILYSDLDLAPLLDQARESGVDAVLAKPLSKAAVQAVARVRQLNQPVRTQGAARVVRG